MNGKARGWRFAALYFLFMMACYFAISAMSPRMRPLMASIHSLYWTFAMPLVAACCALVSAAVLFAVNLLAKRYQASAK
jgi:hypothetical protein